MKNTNRVFIMLYQSILPKSSWLVISPLANSTLVSAGGVQKCVCPSDLVTTHMSCNIYTTEGVQTTHMGCNMYATEGGRQLTWAVTYILLRGFRQPTWAVTYILLRGVRQPTWAVTYILLRGSGNSHGL